MPDWRNGSIGSNGAGRAEYCVEGDDVADVLEFELVWQRAPAVEEGCD
jgi:hypothetical protein